MHKDLPKVYYFISKFDKNNINKLNKNIALIYRNYNKNIDKSLIIQIKKYCKLKKRKFFLSNNFKLAIKLGLDGVYLPSFNNDLKHLNFPKKKDFYVIGSAHPFVVRLNLAEPETAARENGRASLTRCEESAQQRQPANLVLRHVARHVLRRPRVPPAFGSAPMQRAPQCSARPNTPALPTQYLFPMPATHCEPLRRLDDRASRM